MYIVWLHPCRASIWLRANAPVRVFLWNPCASSGAFLFFLFRNGLDERADAAEDGVDQSALVLESGHYECIPAATSLDFAA